MANIDNIIIKNFNFQNWQSAVYIDRWTIPHTLTGFVLGMALSMLGFSKKSSFFITLVLLVSWEIFEFQVGIPELLINRILDVALGIIGYIGARLIRRKYSDGVEKISLYVALLVLLITSSIGWLELVADKATRI
jgi:hypothetical protein